MHGLSINYHGGCYTSIHIINATLAIMIEATNDEIAEELDRQSRVNNIIIHGKKEDDGTDDKAFAENLLKDLKVRTTAL